MALEPGTTAVLQIKDRSSSRWILTDGAEEVAMNESELEEDQAAEDEIEVFLYRNRQGGLSATPLLPRIMKGGFGWAKVLKTSKRDGAVVDIGTTREVYVLPEDLPRFEELWPKPGDELFMTLRTDKNGDLFGRLATEERVMELAPDAPEEMFNKDLKARPYRLLPVGTFLLTIPEGYRVFVHETERKAEPRLGEEVNVRIIEVKEDGTLNGSMLPRKQERLGTDAETIRRYLEQTGGEMPFTDKSTPEEIREMFDMSKAAFKRALGTLLKNGQVVQENGWTKLIR